MKIGTTVEFDAAHFVQTTETKCQRLHGHRWVVEVKMIGKNKLIEYDGMLADFSLVKDMIVGLMDHKILLPQPVNKTTEIGNIPMFEPMQYPKHMILQIDDKYYIKPDDKQNMWHAM